MLKLTVASCAPYGSKVQITSTKSSPSWREKAIIFSLSIGWNSKPRNVCKAGALRRSAFNCVMYGAKVCPESRAASQSRGRSWYFSESK